MGDPGPAAELDPRFSSDGATATPWAEAREQLEDAEASRATMIVQRLADA